MTGNSDLKISSLNVNGIGEFTKRKDVFCYLREKKHDIYFLQETHLKTEIENYIRASWGFDLWLAGRETNSDGVAILFNSSFEYKVHDIKRDPKGCYIALDVDILQKRMTLINIYGPSDRDNPEFLDEIAKVISLFGNEHVISGGDWNCVLDMKIDCNYTSRTHRQRTRNRLKELMADENLIDIFRELYPNKRLYSWRRFNTTKQGRLDYFLISENLGSLIKNSLINLAPIKSLDHALVTISLRKNEFKRDRPFWKFNNSLLRDKKYIEQIKELINTIKQQYALPVYNIHSEHFNGIPSSDIQFTIPDQLFFETLLMEIRGKTISYSSYKKKIQNSEELTLQENIAQLEADSENLHQNINKLEELKDQLQQLRNKKIEGIIVRSKSQWIREGEKASRYFCNLENRNFINKTVGFLDRGSGEIITNQSDILKEVYCFYKNLYSFKEVDDADLTFLKDDAKILDSNDTIGLEGEITIAEIALVLKNMKNNKSPGPDGFTTEFYKFFFSDIGHFLVRSFNESFCNGKLSTTQYQGVITCIPKEGKPKQFIKNWRPISLLNVSYKLLSACIASRIKQVLPSIIHESQKGFMKGRYIGENIRLLYDTILTTEKENIPGLLLMVDFEKAFDSVSWSFIERSLLFFNFPDCIIQWFKVLYNNASSCISFNGQYSEWFKLHRGCRQGDPISPYLYLICAEILSLMIRSNKNIKGLTLKEKDILLSLFADDTTLFLDGSEKSFKEAINILETFGKISGLKINNDKTQIAWLGSEKNSNTKYMIDRNFVWDPGTFKVLGVTFSTNSKDICKLNYDGKINELKRDIARWKKRPLTPLGKITLIKTLFLSKLTYLFINIPDPSPQFLKEVDELFLRFLWGGKLNKIKKSTICKKYEEGGLKMVDIYSFLTTLKLSWVKRLTEIDSSSLNSAHLYPVLCNLEKFGFAYIEACISNIENPFWQDVLKHLKKLSRSKRKYEIEISNIIDEPIFYNPKIKRGNKTIYIKEWETLGILKIKDVLNAENQCMDYVCFKEKYIAPNTNFIVYFGIISAIKIFMNNVKRNPCKYQTILSREMYDCIRKGNKFVKDKLLEDNVSPTSTAKWNMQFNGLNWKTIFTNCFKVSSDSQLQWFQSRLIHRILPTNKYLFTCNLKDSSTCYFCMNERETLNHLFWNCVHVKKFWNDLLKMLQDKCMHCARLTLNEQLILFGYSDNIITDKPINFIILFAKFYIYKCRFQDNLPQIIPFIRQLQNRISIEKSIAFKNNKQREFERNWQQYSPLFE